MITCPVCGNHEFKERSDYEICPFCRWSNDGYQIEHPDSLGCNVITLNDARRNWTEHHDVMWGRKNKKN